MIPHFCPCGEQLEPGEDRCQPCRTPIYIELPAYTGEPGSVKRTDVAVEGNVYVDYDAKGNAVGVEILEGSVRVLDEEVA